MQFPTRFASILTLVLLSTLAVAGNDRQAAVAAYSKAFQFGIELLAKPESQRTILSYERAISLYRDVVEQDPTYEAGDDALYAIATLYDHMHGQFPQRDYKKKAIAQYRQVAQSYPLTRHNLAAINRATQLEAQLNTLHQAAHAPSLAIVSEIRYRSNEDYTRVVIHVDREIEFHKKVLKSPDRIYFDLIGTTPGLDLDGRTYTVDGVFIKKIRVGENRPGVVRVVLDYDTIRRHTVFALFKPFRIVVDTRGVRSEKQPDEIRAFSTAQDILPSENNYLGTTPKSRAGIKSQPKIKGSRTLTRVLGLKVGRVVLDPGHGGSDTGTIGPGGLREKDLVLSIALKLKKLLKKRLDTNVILTRDRDRFVPLEERTGIANQHKADLFISIHGNSSHHSRVIGAETFYLNFASTTSEQDVATRENATSQRTVGELEDLLHQIALVDYNTESQDLAHVVQEGLYSNIKKHRQRFRNRGVKTAPFIVLIGANMPSILTEVGFLSNPSEEKFLSTDEGQFKVAEALYEGVKAYLQILGSVKSKDQLATSRHP